MRITRDVMQCSKLYELFTLYTIMAKYGMLCDEVVLKRHVSAQNVYVIVRHQYEMSRND